MNEMRENRTVSSSVIATRLEKVEEGDKILFNDRKVPLQVTDTNATGSGLGKEISGVEVTGSRGGRYVLSHTGEWYRSLGGYRRSLEWVEIVED